MPSGGIERLAKTFLAFIFPVLGACTLIYMVKVCVYTCEREWDHEGSSLTGLHG